MPLKKIPYLVLAGLMSFTLAGCAPGGPDPLEQAQTLRALWLRLERVEADLTITADYGDRAYEYRARCTGNEEAGELTVTEPASIAGTGTAWAEGETLLEYDGISLETGELSPDGLSPADAMPLFLAALRSGAITEAALEPWGEEGEALVVSTENPRSGAVESRVVIRADPETGLLYEGEIYWANQRVIHIIFHDCTMQLGPEAAEAGAS